jgi:hypothetical protein
MPLSRRLSNSSLGSSSRGDVKAEKSNTIHAAAMKNAAAQGSTPSRRPTLVRRQSSATKLVQEPDTKKMLSTRRKSMVPTVTNSKKRTKDDKENDKCVVKAKNASANGNNNDLTPSRITRSAKKLKMMMANATSVGRGSNNGDMLREGVLMFSPPDQKANAKRQKEEVERKVQER